MEVTGSEALARYLADRDANREHATSLLEGVPHSNASSAGACSRQIAFRAANVPPSDPLTTDALVNFSIGDHVHELVQAALLAHTSPSAAEVSWSYGGFITGRHDFEHVDGQRVLTEIKTMSEFAFEAATRGPLRYVCATCGQESRDHPYTAEDGQTTCLRYTASTRRVRQAPEGPKAEHILQAALSAYALEHDHQERLECPCVDPEPNPLCTRCGGKGWYAFDAPPRTADILRVVYVRKTGVKGEPVVAEWDFPYADWRQRASDELDRHYGIVSAVAEHELLMDANYDGEPITDPASISFPCGYCSHLHICQRLGPGVVPIPEFTPEELAFMAASR